MKKILAVLLATSSVAVFADTFQDFNNNLYADYGLQTNWADDNLAQNNGFGIGGTFQTKNDIWANVNMTQYNTLDGATANNQFGLKAGYAFQFFGNEDSGFQVIPYASFGATDNNQYAWGLGVQPEYRLLNSLKLSMGLGLQGMNGKAGTSQPDSTTLFAMNVNPEVQYDIAKTVMLAVSYNYVTQFNSDTAAGSSGLNVKVGYLF